MFRRQLRCPRRSYRGQKGHRILSKAAQYSIFRRCGSVPVRLLADPAWNANVAVADARALSERSEGRGVSRETSRRRARSLSRAQISSRLRDCGETNVAIWRDVISPGQRRKRGCNESRRENENLYARYEPRRRGKPDRASRVDRRPGHKIARKPAALIHRPRERG